MIPDHWRNSYDSSAERTWLLIMMQKFLHHDQYTGPLQWYATLSCYITHCCWRGSMKEISIRNNIVIIWTIQWTTQMFRPFLFLRVHDYRWISNQLWCCSAERGQRIPYIKKWISCMDLFNNKYILLLKIKLKKRYIFTLLCLWDVYFGHKKCLSRL